MNDRQSTPDILGNMLSPEQAERTELAQALRYDYSQLGAQADEVRDHAIEIKRHEKRASAAIIEGGRHLIAVKESLAHGQWMDWLAVEFNMTDRTARTMMAIAERFDGENGNKISDLNPTVLGMLAAPSVPEEAVKAVVSASSDGKVSVAQAKQIIAEHRPNTANIGTNRPVTPGGTMPKYTVEQLRGMVRACAVETGMTPAGEMTPFWSKLQTWMNQHAGNTLWSVSDLRAALDQVIRQDKTQSTAASPDFASPAVLRAIVDRVWDTLNPMRDAALTMRVAAEARISASEKSGQFWEQCKAAMGDDIRAYRHADLQSAIYSVTLDREMATWGKREAQPVATTQPAPRDRTHVLSDIRTWLYAHAGTPKEIVELGEALHYREFGHPQWDDMFPDGAENDDVYWALEQCIDEAAAKVPEYADGLPAPAPAPVFTFTPATEIVDDVDDAPTPAPADEGRRAELKAWWVRLISLRSDLGDWADLTGRHIETLALGRELTKLLDITQGEIDALEKGVVLA